ncbi:MAG TPA: homoserine O-acetyltransferase [Verrucomicrobiota bacterium]|jgi:homoserine O-acetyltransferase|nr:homoserine O-acetyltransferase [Verrucomicrobiota bacterium]
MDYCKSVTFEGEFKLRSGHSFPRITLAYETYGELNKDASNAILIFHALSGDSHVASHGPDDVPGWWEDAVGPGKAYDTSKYLIICSNVLGGCKGSTGPMFINPKDGKPYGMDFPVVTIEDMVHAQVKLLDHLGIQTVFLATGGSMGGMLALQLAVSYPDRVKNAQILASTGWVSPQTIALNEVARQAIYADPNWNNGDYYDEGHPRPDKGLAVARMIEHITYLCEDSMQSKFGRNLRNREKVGYDFKIDFEVESYLRYRGESFTRRFDANSLLYVTKAIDYFDIAEGFSSLDEALSRIQARILIASYSSDWLFPPQQSVSLASALLRNGIDTTYVGIESRYGHDSFLLEVDKLSELTRDFLSPPSQTALEPLQVACKYLSDEKRQDYALILNIIPPQTRVLDLGCGTGELIERLSRDKSARTRGVDLSEENVRACIARGLSVRQGNIEDGLRDYPEGEFDYVILSQTLPYLDNPAAVVKEMLRVGRRAIISFENAGYWADAFNAGLGKGLGPTLVSGEPRVRAITLEQFEAFAEQVGAVIERAEYFCNGKPMGESEELAELLQKSGSGLSGKAAPAWLADTALYVLLKK